MGIIIKIGFIEDYYVLKAKYIQNFMYDIYRTLSCRAGQNATNCLPFWEAA